MADPRPLRVHVCRRGGRGPKAPLYCGECGWLLATRRCDGPAPKGTHRRTCDAALCDVCATSWEPGVDYCPACALLQAPPPPPPVDATRQLLLFELGGPT